MMFNWLKNPLGDYLIARELLEPRFLASDPEYCQWCGGLIDDEDTPAALYEEVDICMCEELSRQ